MKKKTKNLKEIYAKKDLSPCPGFNTGIEDRLNKLLIDNKSGNYLVKIIKVGEQYKTWIDYEYHSDVDIEITDLTNKDKTVGVTVPGMGAKPIELNTKRKLHTGSFWTWNDFEEQLFEKALRCQTTINNEGYYPKERK